MMPIDSPTVPDELRYSIVRTLARDRTRAATARKRELEEISRLRHGKQVKRNEPRVVVGGVRGAPLPVLLGRPSFLAFCPSLFLCVCCVCDA